MSRRTPYWMGLLLLGGLLLSGFDISPQVNAQLQPLTPEYTFGDQITFRVEVPPGLSFSEVKVIFQSQGDTIPQEATALPSGEDVFSASFKMTEKPLRAFALVTYWFMAITQDNQQLSSPKTTFRYEDNGSDRQTLEEGPFRIRWYEGDETFAQSVLAVAQKSLDQVQKRLGATPPEQINIYIYANALDLQAALRLGHVNWIAGHADSDLGVMLVSLPSGPEQRTLIQQLIPHELSHIMLYQLVGQDSYKNIPAWLNEGLASIAELSPNPDYDRILKKAKEKNSFIPLASLCQSFPLDASGAFLAYAESEWFTRYLVEQYGESGVQELLAAYANGMGCERAPESALGKPLAQIEREWLQAKLGTNALQSAIGELLPWLLLLVLALAAPVGAAIVSERKRVLKVADSQATRTGGVR